MFFKNAWYVAAWSHEITNSLRQIMLLGEKIYSCRTSGSEVIALDDTCPHCKLPLSKGRLWHDLVDCGHHGLTVDRAANCGFAASWKR